MMEHRGGICPSCIKGKMKKRTMRTTSKTSTFKPGDKLSIDISEPHSVKLTSDKHAPVLLLLARGLVAAEGMTSRANVLTTPKKILLGLPKAMGIGRRVCTIKSDQVLMPGHWPPWQHVHGGKQHHNLLVWTKRTCRSEDTACAASAVAERKSNVTSANSERMCDDLVERV